MLSRHFLRAKALQTVYSYVTSGAQTTTEAVKMFEFNVNRLNELGALQLCALREVVAAGRQVIEDGLHKHLPSKEDLHPSYRLVDNMFLSRLLENYDYRKQVDSYKFPWAENADVMRKIYIGFRDTDKFKNFKVSEEGVFENEQRMTLDLFKYIINEENFRELFYERSLLWEDDFDQVAQYNYAMLKDLTDAELDESAPLLMMNDDRFDKDRDAYGFARQLVVETVSHIDENESLIRKHLQNWEFDRVALMDVLIINMAIAELINCPSIPERVTVDESIELAKEFSTDKSKLFINGILDKLTSELRAAGRIAKSGRGLYIPGLEEGE